MALFLQRKSKDLIKQYSQVVSEQGIDEQPEMTFMVTKSMLTT